MKWYEVWTEGYIVNGNSSDATLHTTIFAETFKDAVIAWGQNIKDEYSKQCIDLEEMTFWGCRFFDNETDARRSFG